MTSKTKIPTGREEGIEAVWARQERSEFSRKRSKAENKRIKAGADGGKDGNQEFSRKVRLSHLRSDRQHMRAAPGTFEWKYARDDSSLAPLYHAGSHFARLFERASALGNASVDWAGQGGVAGWKGMPEGRVAALDSLNEAFRGIGKLSSKRLTEYCVEGKTAAEIARRYNIGYKEIAIVLREDLRACALHFRVL